MEHGNPLRNAHFLHQGEDEDVSGYVDMTTNVYVHHYRVYQTTLITLHLRNCVCPSTMALPVQLEIYFLRISETCFHSMLFCWQQQQYVMGMLNGHWLIVDFYSFTVCLWRFRMVLAVFNSLPNQPTKTCSMLWLPF